MKQVEFGVVLPAMSCDAIFENKGIQEALSSAVAYVVGLGAEYCDILTCDEKPIPSASRVRRKLSEKGTVHFVVRIPSGTVGFSQQDLTNNLKSQADNGILARAMKNFLHRSRLLTNDFAKVSEKISVTKAEKQNGQIDVLYYVRQFAIVPTQAPTTAPTAPPTVQYPYP